MVKRAVVVSIFGLVACLGTGLLLVRHGIGLPAPDPQAYTTSELIGRLRTGTLDWRIDASQELLERWDIDPKDLSELCRGVGDDSEIVRRNCLRRLGSVPENVLKDHLEFNQLVIFENPSRSPPERLFLCLLLFKLRPVKETSRRIAGHLKQCEKEEFAFVLDFLKTFERDLNLEADSPIIRGILDDILLPGRVATREESKYLDLLLRRNVAAEFLDVIDRLVLLRLEEPGVVYDYCFAVGLLGKRNRGKEALVKLLPFTTNDETFRAVFLESCRRFDGTVLQEIDGLEAVVRESLANRGQNLAAALETLSKTKIRDPRTFRALSAWVGDVPKLLESREGYDAATLILNHGDVLFESQRDWERTLVAYLDVRPGDFRSEWKRLANRAANRLCKKAESLTSATLESLARLTREGHDEFVRWNAGMPLRKLASD